MSPTAWRSELVRFGLIYAVLAVLSLFIKLRTSQDWFNGTLESNHAKLLAFEYTNNEQSRLLQFTVPEAIRRLTGMAVIHAYMVQRFAFVALAFVLFHAYLRRWFQPSLAFAGVVFLATILPFSFPGDLQESSSLLMVTFLWGLWAIRDGRPMSFSLALFVGATNNETTLILPAVYVFYHFPGWSLRPLAGLAGRTALLIAPAYLVTLVIRYVNREREHLGGAWHVSDNTGGFIQHLLFPTFDQTYFWYNYLSAPLIFGALWVYAYLHWAGKPKFLRAGLLMVPLFVLSNYLTGIISEARQMIPLAYILIPAAFFWLFRDEVQPEDVPIS